MQPKNKWQENSVFHAGAQRTHKTLWDSSILCSCLLKLILHWKKMYAGMTTISCTGLSLYLIKVYQLYAGHVFESKWGPSRPGEWRRVS